jgi:hypothetical protein
VNRHQSQLCFDDSAAEVIGTCGPDCAYRWWTISQWPRRQDFMQENACKSSTGCLLIVA